MGGSAVGPCARMRLWRRVFVRISLCVCLCVIGLGLCLYGGCVCVRVSLGGSVMRAVSVFPCGKCVRGPHMRLRVCQVCTVVCMRPLCGLGEAPCVCIYARACVCVCLGGCVYVPMNACLRMSVRVCIRVWGRHARLFARTSLCVRLCVRLCGLCVHTQYQPWTGTCSLWASAWAEPFPAATPSALTAPLQTGAITTPFYSWVTRGFR